MLEGNHYSTKGGQDVVIREAGEDDFVKIFGVFRAVLSEGLYTSNIHGESSLGNINRPSCEEEEKRKFITMVAEVGGKTVGYVAIEESIWDLSRHVGELGIAVLPEFRGIGVGSALMDSALKVAAERAFEKINLGVFHNNKRAIDLYKKFGFEVAGRKRKQFKLNGEYIDEIIMERFIN